MIGYKFNEIVKTIKPKKIEAEKVEYKVSEAVRKLLDENPKVINVGLESFSKVLKDFSCEVVQYNRAALAGGDMKMIKALQYLRNHTFSKKSGGY